MLKILEPFVIIARESFINVSGVSDSCSSEIAKFQDVQEDFGVIPTPTKASADVAPLAIFPQLEINSAHQKNIYEPDQSADVENTSETQENPINRETVSFVISSYYEEPLTTKSNDPGVNGEYFSKYYLISLTH